VDLLGIIFGIWIYDFGLRSIDRSINNRIKLLRQSAQRFIDERAEEVKLNGGPREKYTDII
jgi:hypothetical protein